MSKEFNSHDLDKWADSHDCSTCPATKAVGCNLKDIVPVIRTLLDWEGNLECRVDELDTLHKQSEDVMFASFTLMVSDGMTSVEVIRSIFSLLITFGYIKGRDYVEIPKPFIDA